MKKTYTKIFFDLDHTLWDFEKNTRTTLDLIITEFDLLAINRFNRDKFSNAFRKANDQLWKLSDRGLMTKEEMRKRRFPYIFEIMKLSKDQLPKDIDEFFITTCPTQNALITGTLDILDYLQSKEYRMSIITNGFSDVQFQKMEASGITHYFEEVITADGSGYKKPDHRIFKHALALCNAKKENALMIGDNLASDIAGGKAAKVDQVFFNEHKIAHQQSPTYEIHRLDQLKLIL